MCCLCSILAGPATGTHSVFSKLTMKQLQGWLENWAIGLLLNSHSYFWPILYRTATVYRTLEPFWGEEYTLHVPNEFQAVSAHVFDYDLMG